MKDPKDPGTKDAFPRLGRPPIAKDGKPMTAAQRQAKRRALLAESGQVERVIRLDALVWEKFLDYCDKHEKSPDELVNGYMSKLVAGRRGTR